MGVRRAISAGQGVAVLDQVTTIDALLALLRAGEHGAAEAVLLGARAKLLEQPRGPALRVIDGGRARVPRASAAT